MKEYRPFNFLLLLHLLYCFPVFSQTYNFKNYTVDNGYPAALANKFYQDNKGFIWICTEGEGISRFDGESFTNFNDVSKIQNGNIKSIVQDTTGSFWIAANNGLFKFDGQNFTVIRPDLFEDKNVTDLLLDDEGILWIGTLKGGLFTYSGEDFIHFSESGVNNKRILCLAKGNDGSIWIGTDNGLARFTNGKLSQFFLTGADEDNTIKKILTDRSNVLWAITPSGLYKIEDQKLSGVKVEVALEKERIFDISTDKTGKLWLATEGGLGIFNGSSFKIINSEHGLVSNEVATISCDKEGNLWIGTDLPVVSLLGTKQIAQYTVKSGLSHNSVLGIAEDGFHNIWLVTSKGTDVYDGRTIKKLEPAEEQLLSELFFVKPDSNGNIWIAKKDLLVGFDCKRFSKISSSYSAKPFYTIEKYNGSAGLFDPANLVKYQSEDLDVSNGSETTFNKISIIYKDKINNIWVGTRAEGLLLFDQNLKNIDLNLDKKITNDGISSIVEDKDGSIWVGTNKHGIYKLLKNENSYVVDKTLDISDGLCQNSIRSLVFDLTGNLWAGTSNGISLINIHTYLKTKKIIITNFGKEDGFLNVECNLNAALKDSEGFLWFGTKGGCIRFFPTWDPGMQNLPQTYISDVKLFYEDVEWKKFSNKIDEYFKTPINPQLSYDNNYLTFEFIGLHYSNHNKVKYQFRLLPSDDMWLPLTDKNNASYSNLDPGNYTFEVRSTINGMGFSSPAKFEFTISKPFWKTWWFFTVLAFSLFGVIYGYIYSNTRTLKVIQRDLEVKVQQRTYQLEEQKNKLQEAYKVIEEKNSEITDSIRYAKNIQEAILPPLHLLKNFLPDSFVFFMPKDIVSGDFYWLAQTDTQVVVAAVDCTGHGVPGAFMSFVGYNLLNQIVNQAKITSPAEILNNLNISVNESLRNTLGASDIRDGMDIAVCTIDIEDRVAQYAGAYNPLYHIRDKQLTILPADRFPVGSYMEMSHKKFTNHRIQLVPGDTIYIFTDGYSDQFGGPDDKKFMYSRFRNLILNVQDLNMTEQKLVLYKEFHNWKGINEQVDDVLVIGIRV